jgi:hypothetical protein
MSHNDQGRSDQTVRGDYINGFVGIVGCIAILLINLFGG